MVDHVKRIDIVNAEERIFTFHLLKALPFESTYILYIL